MDLKTWIEHKNCLIIDMAVLPEKIAILVVKKRDKNAEGKLSALISIRKQLLEFEGYHVLLHDSESLEQLTYQ